jgi:hypothetical protein
MSFPWHPASPSFLSVLRHGVPWPGCPVAIHLPLPRWYACRDVFTFHFGSPMGCAYPKFCLKSLWYTQIGLSSVSFKHGMSFRWCFVLCVYGCVCFFLVSVFACSVERGLCVGVVCWPTDYTRPSVCLFVTRYRHISYLLATDVRASWVSFTWSPMLLVYLLFYKGCLLR